MRRVSINPNFTDEETDAVRIDYLPEVLQLANDPEPWFKPISNWNSELVPFEN